MNETKTVHHRNGTTTTFRHIRLPLPEVARRFAIWTRLLPVGTQDADGRRRLNRAAKRESAAMQQQEAANA